MRSKFVALKDMRMYGSGAKDSENPIIVHTGKIYLIDDKTSEAHYNIDVFKIYDLQGNEIDRILPSQLFEYFKPLLLKVCE